MNQMLREIKEAIQAYERRSPTPADRMSAVDQLCRAIAFQRRVELGYGGTMRTIEPHLIRESSGGRLLLYATRINDDGDMPSCRSYRVDRILSVVVTAEPFTEPDEPEPLAAPAPAPAERKPRNQCGRRR